MYVLELAGEDDAFARAEAASACSGVQPMGPGLARATQCTDRVRGLAFTRAASELIETCRSDIDDAVARLKAIPPDRDGTVAVRARDVRATASIDTQAAERKLGAVLVDKGLTVDLDKPDHELRALFAGDVCALGWLAAESLREFGSRRPTDRPFFQPGSMDPLLARAVVNLAGARPGRLLLDPTCGTGGLLIEAGLVGGDVLGVDVQPRMVRGARLNLRQALEGTTALGPPGSYGLIHGDATRLPIEEGAVDAVAFDTPYGRQSTVAEASGDPLVPGALAEARRVAGRGVLVGDRPWTTAAREAGWTVRSRFERPVHRSLTRHVHVLRAE